MQESLSKMDIQTFAFSVWSRTYPPQPIPCLFAQVTAILDTFFGALPLNSIFTALFPSVFPITLVLFTDPADQFGPVWSCVATRISNSAYPSQNPLWQTHGEFQITNQAHQSEVTPSPYLYIVPYCCSTLERENIFAD